MIIIFDLLLIGNAIIYFIAAITFLSFSWYLFKLYRTGHNSFTHIMSLERLALGLFFFGNALIALKNLSFLGLMTVFDSWRLFTLTYQFIVSIFLLVILWRWRNVI